MPLLRNIKFQKFDKFDNPIFIARRDNKDNYDDKANYEDLKEKAGKLKQMGFNTFLPIFHCDKFNYATIRCMKNPKLILEPDTFYHVDYTIKTQEKNARTYVNCYINLNTKSKECSKVLDL